MNKAEINISYVLLSIFFCSLFLPYLFIPFNSAIIVLPSITFLSIASLVLFTLILTVSQFSEKLYVMFLPFIALAFPSNVNDFFLSVIISNQEDLNIVGFPLVTHVDLFLIFGLFKYANGKHNSLKLPRIFSMIITIFCIYLLVTLLFANKILDIQLTFAYAFQFRFFISLYLVVEFVEIKKNIQSYYLGIILCIFFLFFESMLNTYLNNEERLTSGTLGVNSYANIVSAILVLLVMNIKSIKFNRVITISAIILTIFIILLTETRSALLTALLVLILLNGIRLLKQMRGLAVALSIGLVFLFVMDSNDNDRYQFHNLIESFDFNDVNNFTDLSTSAEITPETSSILTRFSLWNTSINMISNNPVLGIGLGRWNEYKKLYGYDEKVLIDSHNDFLSYLSQYGIILGLLLIVFIYIRPLYVFYKTKNIITDSNELKLIRSLHILNISMLICAFSNSGTFKFQIYAFLILSVFITEKTINGKKEYENCNYWNKGDS